MLSKKTIILSALLLITSQVCLADYAWIPRYHNLNFKLGFDYLSSKENYDSEGQRADLINQSRISEFTQFNFWFEPEYGFAQDFSVYLRPNFLRNSIDPQSGVALNTPTSTGLGDTFFGLKWNLIQVPFILTLESASKIPLYSTSSAASTDLVRGDGDYNLHTIIHAGQRIGRLFSLGLSPGFKARFSGYSSQFTLDGMAGVIYKPVYFRLFFNWATSLDKELPSVLVTTNPEVGSGGSFARLSKNSDSFIFGAKMGFYLYQQYRLDLNFSQSLMGNRSPAYWQIGINLFSTWDFFKPEKKNYVREVPFESEQPTGTEEKEN